MKLPRSAVLPVSPLITGYIKVFFARTGRWNGGRWHVQQDELYSFIKRQGYPTDLLNRESTRILIIDDEFGITKLIMTALSGLEDVIIDYAQSGFSAGTKLEAMKPHIVILDIYVGDIDGREFFKHIRSNPELNDIKVIGISGRMTDEEVRNLYDMGFDEFIAKPFKLKRSETNCIRFYPRLMPWSD